MRLTSSSPSPASALISTSLTTRSQGLPFSGSISRSMSSSTTCSSCLFWEVLLSRCTSCCFSHSAISALAASIIVCRVASSSAALAARLASHVSLKALSLALSVSGSGRASNSDIVVPGDCCCLRRPTVTGLCAAVKILGPWDRMDPDPGRSSPKWTRAPASSTPELGTQTQRARVGHPVQGFGVGAGPGAEMRKPIPKRARREFYMIDQTKRAPEQPPRAGGLLGCTPGPDL
mmetsp:Transcript_22564/g.58559  ORF Transcript_22564/g.58559 Transcript_22564/m.58559 type:complete len:233 (+) Transcript_22564:65-763(+)